MRRSGRSAIPASRRVRIGRWLAAALGSCAATALAQAPDTSSWVCQYCPFPDGYRAEYTAGADYVSDDSAYLGDATGYDDSGVYPKLSGDGSYLSQRYQARWRVEDLGLDSRALSLAGGRQGLYDFRLSYRELPRREFDTTRTIFSRSGDASLALPAGWQRASLTSGFTGLDAALAGRNIGSDRKTLEMGAAYLPLQALKLSASYTRIEKSGVDIAAGSYFTQSSLLPRPLDYSTDNVMLSARIAMDRGYLAAAWQGSFFQNTLLGTSWESPFLTAAGAETGRTAQAPDNRFQQLSLSGGYRLDGWDTYMSFSAAAGRATQDDVLLPYTTNGTLTTAALPRARLDGDALTARARLRLFTSPSRRAKNWASTSASARTAATTTRRSTPGPGSLPTRSTPAMPNRTCRTASAATAWAWMPATASRASCASPAATTARNSIATARKWPNRPRTVAGARCTGAPTSASTCARKAAPASAR